MSTAESTLPTLSSSHRCANSSTNAMNTPHATKDYDVAGRTSEREEVGEETVESAIDALLIR